MDKKCLICDSNVIDGYCEIGEKGIRRLMGASILRNDEKSKSSNTMKNGVVHKCCRKVHTRPDSIKKTLKEPTNQQPSTSQNDPRLRSGEKKFDFKNCCLFCAERTDDAFYKMQTKKTFASKSI